MPSSTPRITPKRPALWKLSERLVRRYLELRRLRGWERRIRRGAEHSGRCRVLVDLTVGMVMRARTDRNCQGLARLAFDKRLAG